MEDIDNYLKYQPGTLWFNSMNQIFKGAFSNALLAYKGVVVKQISMQNEIVTAKIKDYNSGDYLVNIRFDKFNNDIFQKLKDYFYDNPVDCLELNLQDYSSLLIKKLKDNGINIIPDNLEDIEITCSCHKKLCNHIFLVFNHISKKINKNPNLLFSLRGISVSELILAAGFSDEILEITDKNPAKKFVSCKNIMVNNHQFQEFSEKDLLFPVQDIESMLSLIQEDPSYYDKDKNNFRSKLLEIYQTILDGINSVTSLESPVPVRNTAFYIYYSKNNNLKAFVSPSNYFLYYLKSKGSRLKYTIETMPVPVENKETQELDFIEQEGIVLSIDTLFEYFLNITNSSNIANLSESGLFLHQIASLSLALIKSASFVPEIIAESDTKFIVRYIPLILNKAIEEKIECINSAMPQEMVFVENSDLVFLNNGGYFLLSAFMTFIIDRLFFLKSSKLKINTVSSIFIKDKSFNAASQSDRDIAVSISSWLKGLSFRNKNIRPVLRLESDKSGTKFNIYIDITDKRNNLVEIIPLSELFDFNKEQFFSLNGESVRTDICKQILHASNFMHVLREILNSKGKYSPEIDLKEMLDIITRIAPVLNKLGINVIIPKELHNFAKFKISLKAKYKVNSKKNLNFIFDAQKSSTISLDDILNFSYEIALGDSKITKEEFLELVNSAENIIKYKDQYVLLNPDEISSILEQLSKPVPKVISSRQLLHSAISGVVNDIEFDTDEAVKKALTDYIKVDEIDSPDTLNGKLRPYQKRGFEWLYSNYLRGFGSCLADDMGLGKTIQAISLILKLKEMNQLDKPTIVVCPTTLVGNWVKECEKFAPSLRVGIYYGADRSFDLDNIDILMTTYAIVRIDNDKFKDKQWSLAIIDEAQNIKNNDTSQSQAVKSLNADNYIAMTGTPVENRLTELWSIFDFLNKGYLGSIYDFQNVYSTPIERFRDEEKIIRLRKATAPFILRRLKIDKSVIDDLPDKIIIDEYCYLAKEQAALYEKVLQSSMSSIETSEGINRRGQIFKLITSLKQICNHPVHFTKEGKLSRELSGKADTTLEIIENVLENDEKAIIFTQYKEMGQLLVNLLKEELGQEALFFHGSLSREKRDVVIDKFQNNPESKLMVLSLKAGGTGLNLTAATNVIHYDLWWNPAVEDQATDRAFRIGQNKNVNVYRLISIGTFEEKIDEIIKSKKELANLTVSTGEKWLSDLSNQEIRDLFSLTRI